jgi:phage portal protein BeeE
LDPYRGLSPVLSILPDLDTSRYAAEWSRAFFINSAQPGGIIEVPQPLSDPDFDQLRDRWNEQHKGVGNAHRSRSWSTASGSTAPSPAGHAVR